METHSTWETIELPLLHAIRFAEIEGSEPDLTGFFEERAIPEARAASVIDRLREGDLITGTFYKTMGSVFPRFFADVRLTAAGARAVGMWPTADPAQAFIAALEVAIGQADSPESKSRLSKALDALAEVPAAVLTGDPRAGRNEVRTDALAVLTETELSVEIGQERFVGLEGEMRQSDIDE